jgi:dicarboxylate transporter 10
MAVKVIRDDGFLALYNGLSASCLRQGTYTTIRFAIYGAIKSMKTDSNLSFIEKISLAAGSGAVGAFFGLLNIFLIQQVEIWLFLRCTC